MTSSKWIHNNTIEPVEVCWRSIKEEVFGFYLLLPGDTLKRNYPLEYVREVCISGTSHTPPYLSTEHFCKRLIAPLAEIINVSEVIDRGEAIPRFTSTQERTYQWIYNDTISPVSVSWISVQGESFKVRNLIPGKILERNFPLNSVLELKIRSKDGRGIWHPPKNDDSSIIKVSDIVFRAQEQEDEKALDPKEQEEVKDERMLDPKEQEEVKDRVSNRSQDQERAQESRPLWNTTSGLPFLIDSVSLLDAVYNHDALEVRNADIEHLVPDSFASASFMLALIGLKLYSSGKSSRHQEPLMHS